MPRIPVIHPVVLCLAILVGCGGQPPGESEGEVDTRATDRTDEPVSAATPETGAAAEPGLHALVADIRVGVESLPATVGPYPDSARQVAVRLYVTRQEAIEAKWGPGTEGPGESPLTLAVADAEHRFHDLMELMNATPPPDSAAVAEAVTALDRQLAEVLRRAEERGIQ